MCTEKEQERVTEKKRKGRGKTHREVRKTQSSKEPARNSWEMTVLFQSGNGEGSLTAFKISLSVYHLKNDKQSSGAPAGCGWKSLRGALAILSKDKRDNSTRWKGALWSRVAGVEMTKS